MTEACRGDRPTSRTLPLHNRAGGEAAPARSRGRRGRTGAATEASACSLRTTLDHIDIGMIVLSGDLRTRFMNRRFRELWGIPDALADRRPRFRDVADRIALCLDGNATPQERARRVQAEQRAIRNGQAVPRQVELPDGRCVRVGCAVTPDGGRVLTYCDISETVRDSTASAVNALSAELRFATETLESQGAYLVSLAEETEEIRRRADLAREMLEREIEERRTVETQLRHVATTDSLTGVLNRAAFLVVAERELQRARRHGHPLSMLMLDADFFKNVNDRHGHAGGDTVLKHIAQAALASMRAGDSIGRLGGEEFAIVLPGASLETGEQVAERLRARIAEQTVWHGDKPIAVTVSVGVGAARPTDRTIEQVIARADTALYAAKGAGRNRVVPERAA